MKSLLSGCHWQFLIHNRPRSIYQYSNMTPRLSGQNSIFAIVFFVSNSLLGIERQKKLEKFVILTRKPRGHARILVYRTWPIKEGKDSFKLLLAKNLRTLSYKSQNILATKTALNFKLINHSTYYLRDVIIAIKT